MPRNMDMSKNDEKEKKMRLFIKADNYNAKFAWIITLIADVALIVFGIQEKTFKSYLIACGLTILVTVLWLLCRNEGLLIENNKLCYKGLRKKNYELNQIAGIHIVKDQIYLGNLISIDLKIKGEYKYKIIYLKDKDFENRSSDNGVCDFHIHHGKHILFTTVYDEKAIEYFKSKGIGITGVIK